MADAELLMSPEAIDEWRNRLTDPDELKQILPSNQPAKTAIAEIIIASDGKSAHLLPQSVLTLNDEGTLGVRTVTAEKKADFVPVTMLRDTIDGVWLAGLPEAADVIVIGQEYVIPGVPVEASYQETNE